MTEIVLLALVFTSGLLAGFFFAYWCSVMLGLKNVGDEVFVETMQQINAVLPNGRFIIPFFAPVFLSAIATWLTFADDANTAGWWSVAATVLAVITLGITVVRNVPMNNALAEAGTPVDASDALRVREEYESPWTAWNDVRTYTSALTFVAAIGALATL